MQPLAERMRPRRLEDYVGQAHLLGEGAVLRQALAAGFLPSTILWGPPGVGKTTLATLIAEQSKRPFYALSAVHAGVKEVRETIQQAQKQQFFGRPNPLLFIDEIHRFSKSQQDALLGAVEKGIVTLLGATTENPSFEVIPALLSRCQVYVLHPLTVEQLLDLTTRAFEHDEVLRQLHWELRESAALFQYAGGDARKLYNILELLATTPVEAGEVLVVTDALVQQTLQQHLALYDKGGELHYDMASALIKSIRGSDPNAAVYWLARMLEGGEDIKFIARRLVIAAAEDIGLANPNALLMAQTAFQAVQAVGLPEARIILAQAAIYLATAAKSNTAYLAIETALALVRQTGNLPVPLHLRNAPTALMKELQYGQGYQYAHNHPGNFVDQHYLPEALQGQAIYQPGDNPAEQKLREWLRTRWPTIYDQQL